MQTLKPSRLFLPFLLIFILSACDPIRDGPAGSCEELQSGWEISFGMAYCQGDFCSTYEDEDGGLKRVTSQEECESIDVIVQGNIEEWGQDGKPDCQWIEDKHPYCIPNK